ncbi:hypothetical protein GSI_09895 [Ganoderma sinense ZZ0214-1]|uniref:Uncharacterized protein n=1 Tax=Ganoderma sinense ZZ0214-1 TaxID=1077348 RepID=A0A2G8S2S2_9APHY|nr:hypothetical protein GSI_09895 [Ganoderma sinense ZZ0214-1]
MLNPQPPPGLTPTIIPFVVNAHPFYDKIELRSGDPDSVTVSAILKKAGIWFGYGYNKSLSLRWITDEDAAFVPDDDPKWSRRMAAARAWYFDKGHCLTSEPIDTDDSLRKRLRSAGRALSSGTSAGEIRLYITRMAALYDPAFAYAQEALRGVRDGEDGDVLEGRRFMAQLRDALRGLGVVEAGGSGSDMELNEVETSAHAAALGKVLQELFDDPALKVTANVWSRRIKIEAECPTPCRVPARYIVGKGTLMSACDPADSGGASGVHESMVAYRDAMLDRENAHIFAATCCPSLVIATAGSTVQIYAAYLADWVYRTHLCDFAFDADADEHRDATTAAAKVRIIRNTARMLREATHAAPICSPARHSHARPAILMPAPPFSCPPRHSHARPAILMPAPLPLRLYLLDRVMVGRYGDLFTGKLRLPGPPSCSHADDDNNNNNDSDNYDGPESAQTQARELPVHVKFVKKYGVAAHRLLAAHTDASGAPRPLAPQLYWAGEVVSGLLMIVMETLPPDVRVLCRYSRENPGPGCSEPPTWDELGDVRAAVRLLHAHGFVHGDIRDWNVMLQRQSGSCAPANLNSDASSSNALEEGGSSGISPGAGVNLNGAGTVTAMAPHAYLIDFDWAGKEGEVRYPTNPNPDILWPRPASELPGQLVTKDDDTFMLERLLQDSQESEHEHCEHDREQDDEVHERKRKRSADVDKCECKHKRDDGSDNLKQTWDGDHDHDGQSDSEVELE